MALNAHDAYLETRVLSADRLELVRLLHQACIGAVRDARRHLAARDIAARTGCISRAHAILLELSSSLDAKAGGQLAARLGGLYDYMQRRLLQSNFEQSDAPLAEVLGLLSTLAEAWDGIGVPPAAGEPDVPWSGTIPAETALTSAAHGWSL